ncbi:MAG: transcription elongation factor GreA [Chloroflexota bacterium]|nr:transcription elongation factor GreA [Chloroflexota bacterium]
MAQKEIFLTPEGLDKLKTELEHLRSVRRQQVAEQIHRAKELGGTVDNAEYDDAKNEQAFVEGRVLTLEQMIKNASIIPEDHASSEVKLGSKVTVRHQDGEEESFTILGSAEASPSERKISNESPVGSALMEKRVGDVVEASIPSGTIKLTVVAIE